MKTQVPVLAGLLSALFLVAAPAAALELHTFVSGTGLDSNPCTRSSPCLTLGVAVSNTFPGGVVRVIDAGQFGTIFITKPVTIEGSGLGTIQANINALTGVIVNITDPAYTDKTVKLRNLSIQSAGDVSSGSPQGLEGIFFAAGGPLHIEGCSIHGFQDEGIECTTSVANSKLFIKDTVIQRCSFSQGPSTAAVYLRPTAALVASLDNVRIEGNYQAGLRAQRYVTATVKDSVIAGNALYGVLALSSVAPAADITLEGCVIAGNSPGLQSNGAVAIIRCSNVSIVKNGAAGGIVSANSGKFRTFGNNRVDGNGGAAASNNFPAGSSLPEE